MNPSQTHLTQRNPSDKYCSQYLQFFLALVTCVSQKYVLLKYESKSKCQQQRWNIFKSNVTLIHFWFSPFQLCLLDALRLHLTLLIERFLFWAIFSRVGGSEGSSMGVIWAILSLVLITLVQLVCQNLTFADRIWYEGLFKSFYEKVPTQSVMHNVQMWQISIWYYQQHKTMKQFWQVDNDTNIKHF